MACARRILGLASLIAGISGVALCQAGNASADAPADEASRLSVGLRLGVAGANLSLASSTLPRIAPIAGVFVESRVSPRLSLVLDVLYTEYGGNGVNPLPFYGTDSLTLGKLTAVAIRSQAVEVPLQLKLRLARSGPIAPYVSFGGSAAWFFATTSNNTVVAGDTTRQFGLNMNSEIHRFDVAALAALGAEIRSTRMRWSVEAFYRYGLTEFDRTSTPGVAGYSANAAGVKFGFVP